MPVLTPRWRQDTVAGARRLISTDGRTLNWTVLLAGPTLLLWGLWYGVENARPTRILFLVVALVVVISFSAARFSTALTRSVLLAGVVVLVIGLVHVGRDSMTADRAEEARLRATELRIRLDAAIPAERPGSLADEEAVTKALRELNDLVAAAPASPTTTALRPLLDELLRLTPQRIATRLGDLQTVVDALDDARLRDRATAAITLIKEPPAATPPAKDPTTTQAAKEIRALCEAGSGALSGTQPSHALGRLGQRHRSPKVCRHAKDGKVSLTNLDDQDARADLEVARYELAVAETEEAKKALGAAVESRSTAYATALRSKADGEVEAVDALREGAGEVMGSLGGLGDDEGPQAFGIDLGAAGWLLFGGLALLWYRAVERRAVAKALGPVTVDGDSTHLDQFRGYLHRNVPDPGAVPGAAALLPITDLLAVTKTPAGHALSKIMTAIVAVLDQKRGYSVTFKSLPPDGAGAERKDEKPAGRDEEKGKTNESEENAKEKAETVVSVRVSETRTGALVEQRLVRDEKPSEAIRKAAYWAATVVIDRSDRVPRWAHWPSVASDSLAAYQALEDKGQEEALEVILQALSRAPRSGVLCLQLSHAYALNGRHLDAFELALRAAAVGDHYLAARYRLAITASLVASEVDANWRTRAVEQRARVLGALRRYPHSPDTLAKALGGSDDDVVRKALCDFALAELGAIHRLLMLPRLFNNSLRRSERRYWLAFLGRREGGVSARTQFLRAIDSARPAILRRGISSATWKKAAGVDAAKAQAKAAQKIAEQEAKAASDDPKAQPKAAAAARAKQTAEAARAKADAAARAAAEVNCPAKAAAELEKVLADRATFWQVAYNVACYDAIRYDDGGGTEVAAEAMEHLESALERPQSHQLTRSWVEKDPDLKSLRFLSRFKAFSTLLYDDRRSDADS